MYPPLLLSLLRRADQVLVLVLTVAPVCLQSESPSEPPSRCEVESSVFTTPGDVNPVAESNYWTCM